MEKIDDLYDNIEAICGTMEVKEHFGPGFNDP